MPNDGRGSPLFRRPLSTVLRAVALACVIALAGCSAALPTSLASAGRDATAGAAARPDETLDEFTQRLAGAILERDAVALAGMMTAEFRLAEWQGRGRLLAPEEAAAEIADLYLAAASALAFDAGADVAARLGRDPLAMWPGVDAVGALYLTGLATDSVNDAALIIAQAEGGGYAWAGMLVGPEGFAQSGEGSDGAAAYPARLDIRHAVEVYAAPGAGAAPVGVLNFGQVVNVLGMSADGGWWQIQCPEGVAGECWVGNAPADVLPLGSPTAQPTAAQAPAEPTATPTRADTATPLVSLTPSTTPSPTPSPTLTRPAPTATATTPPTATPTAAPTVAPTVAPTATPTATPERIRFGVGEVSATRQGTLGPQQRKQYVLNVAAGQTLSIQIGAPGNAANFAVTGVSDGQPYKRLENEDRTWSMAVPRTQDYLVTVAALEQAPYTLYIYIPPPDPTPMPTAGPPERVTFGTGQTAAVLNGRLAPDALDRYLLRAVGGQTMYLSLTSDTGDATFGVYGFQDGSVLKRYEVRGDTWSGVLPSSQDYLVTVMNGGPATTLYSLAVSFSPLGSLPPTPAPPERIRFAPGAMAATVEGTVAPGGARAYVLAARGGQTLELAADAPPGSVILGIRGANGAQLLNPAAGRSSASVLLTTTQDYTVTVYSTGGQTEYTLTVAIY